MSLAARLGLVLLSSLIVSLSVASAEAREYVYAGGSRAVSQYKVGTGGRLVPLSPASVPVKEGPAGLATSPDGRSIYVASSERKVVRQFRVDARGRLSPKNPGTVSTGGRSASGIVVSPDGDSVYVTANRAILQYDVGAHGRLSSKDPAFVTGLGHPTGRLAASPNGKSVYATTCKISPGNYCGNVAQFDVDSKGRLSPKDPLLVAVSCIVSDVEVAPNGGTAYVTHECGGGGGPSPFEIGADGTLTQSTAGPGACGSSYYPHDVAISPDGKSLYANNNHTLDFQPALCQADIGIDGGLSPKSPDLVPLGSGSVNSIVVSPNGRSVYASGADATGSVVRQYDVGEGGMLSYKNPPTVAGGGGEIVISRRCPHPKAKRSVRR